VVPLSRKELEFVEHWTGASDLSFVKHENTVFAWPEDIQNNFHFLLNSLRPVYSGTIIGELVRNKLVPHHALAMSRLWNPAIRQCSLDCDTAIHYLQRKEIKPATTSMGWQLVSYEGQILGWINVLSNRVNNYYPKELRILKDNPAPSGNI
jgi:NOL1/NOP2/fmu family ribosome biogenesis protein